MERLTLAAGTLAAITAFAAWRDVAALHDLIRENKMEQPNGIVVFEWRCRVESHGHSAPVRLEVRQGSSTPEEWIRFGRDLLTRQQAEHPPETAR